MSEEEEAVKLKRKSKLRRGLIRFQRFIMNMVLCNAVQPVDAKQTLLKIQLESDKRPVELPNDPLLLQPPKNAKGTVSRMDVVSCNSAAEKMIAIGSPSGVLNWHWACREFVYHLAQLEKQCNLQNEINKNLGISEHRLRMIKCLTVWNDKAGMNFGLESIECAVAKRREIFIRLVAGQRLWTMSSELNRLSMLVNSFRVLEQESQYELPLSETELVFRHRVCMFQFGHPAFYFLPMFNEVQLYYAWCSFLSASVEHNCPLEIPWNRPSNVGDPMNRWEELLQLAPNQACRNWIHILFLTELLPKNLVLYEVDPQIPISQTAAYLRDGLRKGLIFCL
ncbi:hypothetical protein SJAG_02476 [Schizosaccharomyces japonicus yFS275]|uniref:Uncharacterized protein n=1 Tax=Schizosaccharomyces japonicus (strain yFS275 / FY16936) TaxID=402676 RepID=B6K2K8_SCHJY|nr:hypothetical protein SJAG_02476 [Schizosaccharomyces japonicus yFS275]EEB07389.1 hypothetical protein SJAG_02476 [Schizosaccharomyces japonicus yFS275]